MADVYATSSTGIAAASGDASIHVINDKSFSWIRAVTLAKLLECEMWSIEINKILGGDFIVFFRVWKSQFHPKIISFINFSFCIRHFFNQVILPENQHSFMKKNIKFSSK